MGVLALLSVPLLLRRSLQDALPEALAAPVAAVGYAWMGLALFVVLALLGAEYDDAADHRAQLADAVAALADAEEAAARRLAEAAEQLG